MRSKLVLSLSATAFGVFGAGWFFLPDVFYRYWAIVPDSNRYMGRRYGAFMLGLMVISWLARRRTADSDHRIRNGRAFRPQPMGRFARPTRSNGSNPFWPTSRRNSCT